MAILSKLNYAKAEMLIRRPVSEVFQAFVDPAVTTKFWFTKSSGALLAGQRVEWTWEMFNVTVPVLVNTLEPNKLIEIEWGNSDELTRVEWIFKRLNEDSTFVSIVNDGFAGEPQQIIAQVRDSTEGFALVLAGLKAYLEHGIQVNLIADRFPPGTKH